MQRAAPKHGRHGRESFVSGTPGPDTNGHLTTACVLTLPGCCAEAETQQTQLIWARQACPRGIGGRALPEGVHKLSAVCMI